MVKQSVALIVTLLITMTALAETRYVCQGYIVNGWGDYHPNEVRYSNAITHHLSIDCGWLKSLRTRCSGSWDNIRNAGYFIENSWSWFDGPVKDQYGAFWLFDRDTMRVDYKISDGPPGTNQNDTQRWYSGRCFPE